MGYRLPHIRNMHGPHPEVAAEWPSKDEVGVWFALSK
jgi:hypothetical protein